MPQAQGYTGNLNTRISLLDKKDKDRKRRQEMLRQLAMSGGDDLMSGLKSLVGGLGDAWMAFEGSGTEEEKLKLQALMEQEDAAAKTNALDILLRKPGTKGPGWVNPDTEEAIPGQALPAGRAGAAKALAQNPRMADLALSLAAESLPKKAAAPWAIQDDGSIDPRLFEIDKTKQDIGVEAALAEAAGKAKIDVGKQSQLSKIPAPPGNNARMQYAQWYLGLDPKTRAVVDQGNRGIQYLDRGSEFVARPDATGFTPGMAVEKDLAPNQLPSTKAAQAEATAIGKGSAERTLGADKVLAQSQQALKTLRELRDHEALESVVGIPDGFSGLMVRMGADALASGTPEADFGARLKTVQGQQFLQAFESLKGGGQITQIEGDKGTQAQSSMSTAQSPEDFRKALDDYMAVIESGVKRLEQGIKVPDANRWKPKSGSKGSPSGSNPAPDTNEALDDLLNKYAPN